MAGHPGIIGLQSVVATSLEYLFVSGDRCDVVFDLAEGAHAVVEVKNGERGELVKGMYQAVKYRALREAEEGHGEPYPVNAYLVAYDGIPEDIEALGNRLAIRCFAVPRSDVASETMAREETHGAVR